MSSSASSSARDSAPLTYLSGFGNEHATEALPNSLPVGQNSPQRPPRGLYAEQLSGTAFTVPRARARRSWLYRIHPSVGHEAFVPAPNPRVRGSFASDAASGGAAGALTPNQLRWFPPPVPAVGVGEPVDWLSGLWTVAGAGAAELKHGLAIHMWACNAPMRDVAFYNADGDLLLVPQEGALRLQTEMGLLDVAPGEIAVVPRGVRFRVDVGSVSRGYVLEVFGAAFALPDLGAIGSNGLANARDFLYPTAAFETREVESYVIIAKFGGHFFSTAQKQSPFDVVAWHGTHAPYKYDLSRFNTIGTVSFDHPDPSIFTVLTSPSDSTGCAVADFVIFPPRWMVGEHTFRPPWFHRNCMAEFMGMIWGKYDAKVGFQPGGASLHSIMSPHGPDAATVEKATAADLGPEKFGAGLAFMFETSLFLRVSEEAMAAPYRDADYQKCWMGLKTAGGSALL